jgi:hypothetical protein
MKVLVWISFGCSEVYSLDSAEKRDELFDTIYEICEKEGFVYRGRKDITHIVSWINYDGIKEDWEIFDTLEIVELK